MSMNPVIIYGISLVMIISLIYAWIKGKVIYGDLYSM